jgi:hypothetical protein
MLNSVFRTFAIVVAAAVSSSMSFAHDGHEHPPLAGHLSFKKNTLHIHASFQEAPSVEQEAVLVLEAKDAKTHQAVELDDDIEVELWMPAMGHGSAPTQVERVLGESGEIIPGKFIVRNIYFVMGGEWEVKVSLTDSQGAHETKSFKVTLTDEDHGSHH